MALRTRVLAAAASLLAAAACSSEPALELPAEDEPLLAMVWGPRISWGFRGGDLVRLDRHSLAPAGPRISLGPYVSFGWSFSPDRDRIVFGGLGSSLLLVDARRLRRLGDVDLGGRGTVVATAWPTPRRIVVAIQRPYENGRLRLAVVDPVTRLVLERRPLARRSVVIDGAASSAGLTLLLAPPDSVGTSRLVLVDPDGRIRSTLLDAIESGTRVVARAGLPVERRWFPGLAVDPVGRRAFVAGGGATVAEIDLTTMRVGYRTLTKPVSLLGRVRGWLDPAARAKGEAEGPVRSVRRLGDGILAVTGWDARGTEAPTAAGLKLVDTRRWTVRTLDDQASRLTVAGDLLLAHGCCSSGLSAYDPAGRRLWHRYEGETIHDVEAFGDVVYVYRYVRDRDRVDVLELEAGRIDRSLERPRFQLMDPPALRRPPR